MKAKGNRIGKKVLSLVLCLAIVLGLFSGISFLAEAANNPDTVITMTGALNGLGTKNADAPTVNNWKDLFGPSAPNTQFAGGIWTDKSVFTSVADYTNATAEAENAAAVKGLQMDNEVDNFLVSLSAIASTKTVVGHSYLPTDTMLVLDVSASMKGNAATSMVKAANEAIAELLALNSYNRVGVVLYSGNSNLGNSAASTATVLLPLDRYTRSTYERQGGTWVEVSTFENILTCSAGTTQTVGVNSNVKNAAGTTIGQTTSKNVAGGTYIQNGLYKAMQEFTSDSNNPVVPEGKVQAGTTHIPILVLMSDGAPTAATTQYKWIGSSNMGDGNSTSDPISFATQLTAAYVKQQIEQYYQKFDPTLESKFYTLGLQVGNDEHAMSVMNPTAYTTNGITKYWESFLNTTDGGSVNLGNGKDVAKDPTLADYRYYANQYFAANTSDQLSSAFQSIVEEIIIQSMYYPTMVEEDGPNQDGFVEFVDYIGQNMQIKDIKGIQLGENLYTGETMARMIVTGGMGSVENPTEAGDNLVWSVIKRFNMNEDGNSVYGDINPVNVAEARELIGKAYDAGQLSYVVHGDGSVTYSNYIGWYARENSEGEPVYLGFWDGQSTDDAPAGATMAIKSYGFYDAVGEGYRKTDMMYATIQIREYLQDYRHPTTGEVLLTAGETALIGRLPASLIPLVEYHVTLNETDLTAPTGLTISGATAPSRLIYEVGLHDRVDLLDNSTLAPNTPLDEDGNYVLYTSKWDANWDDGSSEPETTQNTHVRFEPSHENERYYFHEDTVIYASPNVPYTGTGRPTGGVYPEYIYYKEGDTVRVEVVWNTVSELALSNAEHNGSYWVIPKGTIQLLEARDAIEKDGNHATALPYSEFAQVHYDPANGVDYHLDAILGNNGSMTVSSYEGIKLTKLVDSTLADAELTYTFRLAGLAAGTDYTVFREAADGTRTGGSITANASGVAEVELAADNSIYVVVPTGTDVTITEDAAYQEYQVKSVTVNGNAVNGAAATVTVEENLFAAVAFTNTKVFSGDVSIGKKVVSSYADHAKTEFTFHVTVTGAAPNTQYTTQTVGTTENAESITTGSDGSASLTVKLTDSEYFWILDLPAGTVVAAAEDLTGMGWFTADKASDSVTTESGQVKTMLFTNTYVSAATSLPLHVDAYTEKLFTGREWDASDRFEFVLERYGTDGSYTPIDQVAVTAADAESGYLKEFGDLHNESFTEAGTYTYRIRELAGTAAGITYDQKVYYFNVVVADDGEGQLYIADVSSLNDPGIVTPGADGDSWTVSTGFTNNYSSNAAVDVTLNITKTLNNSTSIPMAPSGFQFVLTETEADFTTPISDTAEQTFTSGITGSISLPHIQFTKEETRYFTLKELQGSTAGITQWDAHTYEIVMSAVLDEQTGDLTVTLTVDGALIGSETYALTHVTATLGQPQGDVQDLILQAETPLSENAVVHYQIGEEAEQTVPYNADGTVIAIPAGAPATVTFWMTDGALRTVDATFTYTPGSGDAGASLSAPSYDTQNATTLIPTLTHSFAFENTFTPRSTATTLAGTKLLNGRSFKEGDAFTFELYETGSDFAVTGAAKANTTAKANGGEQELAFAFAPITYSDIGTHYYVVKEQVGDHGGITYDTHSYHVVVSVTYDGNGNLQATSSITNGTSLTFTNTYKTEVLKDVEISGTKTLNGSHDLMAGQFDFELLDSTGKVIDTVSNGPATVNTDNRDTARFTFKLTYTEPGTYTYKVREKLPEGAVNGVYNGTTYDSTEYTVTVTVVDNGNGTLRASTAVTGGAGNGAITFTNSYTAAPVKKTISGTKTVSGLELFGAEFTFTLYAADRNYVLGRQLDATNNNGNGSFAFAPQTYTATGAYHYVVVEEQNNTANIDNDHIIYDGTIYNVEIIVTDNMMGSLVASDPVIRIAGMSDPVDTLTFHNVVMPEPIVVSDLGGTKSLLGRTPTAGEFTFALYAATLENGRIVAVGEPLLTAANDANGDFVFADKPETAEGPGTGYLTFGSAGTHFYVVKEQIPQGAELVGDHYVKDGIIYDSSVYQIAVTINDVMEGQRITLVPSVILYKDNVQITEDPAIVFENIEASSVTASLDISAEKTMGDQMEPATGSDFSFTLYEATVKNNKVTLGTKLQTTSNTNSAVSFERISYSYDTSATYPITHHYVVKEDIPSEAKLVDGKYRLDGVNYDATSYLVTVTVSYDARGILTASAPIYQKLENGEIAAAVEKISFNNSYSVDELLWDLTLPQAKKLSGRDLKAGEFTFELYRTADDSFNITGVDHITATNAADGTVTFEDVSFTEAGTYYFLLKEQAGSLQNVTYDKSEYRITVQVDDGGKGTLGVASMTWQKLEYKTGSNGTSTTVISAPETIVFTNIYNTPSSTPTTGDSSPLALWLTMMIVAGGGLLAILVYPLLKRRQRRG